LGEKCYNDKKKNNIKKMQRNKKPTPSAHCDRLRRHLESLNSLQSSYVSRIEKIKDLKRNSGKSIEEIEAELKLIKEGWAQDEDVQDFIAELTELLINKSNLEQQHKKLTEMWEELGVKEEMEISGYKIPNLKEIKAGIIKDLDTFKEYTEQGYTELLIVPRNIKLGWRQMADKIGKLIVRHRKEIIKNNNTIVQENPKDVIGISDTWNHLKYAPQSGYEMVGNKCKGGISEEKFLSEKQGYDVYFVRPDLEVSREEKEGVAFGYNDGTRLIQHYHDQHDGEGKLNKKLKSGTDIIAYLTQFALNVYRDKKLMNIDTWIILTNNSIDDNSDVVPAVGWNGDRGELVFGWSNPDVHNGSVAGGSSVKIILGEKK
jgi:hypothetical protein